ncbi:MAG: T9SS type A sorting domain-containing protein [Bacteroidota bacterium]|nr:T9SS type A sorting domain-containing protein [Bacteroidota bacterium]
MKRILYLLLILTYDLCFSQNEWTWKNPYPVGAKLNGIFFINNSIIFAVGDAGNVLESTNSGTTWENKVLLPHSSLQKISFANNQYGIIIGGDESAENGGLFVTTDGGVHWSDQYPLELQDNHRYAFFDIQLANDSIGWIGGFTGVLKTTDRGTTWQKTIGASGWTTSLCFINDSAGWSTNSVGGILKSTDKGGHWTTIASLGWYWTKRIRFVTPAIGWIVGRKLYDNIGFIAKTTDGGATWKFQDSSGVGYNDLCIIDSLNVVAVGDNGLIQYTTDGGNMWLYSGTNNHDDYNNVALKNNKLWVIGGSYNYPAILTNNVDSLSWLWNVQKTYFTLSSLNAISFADDSLGWLSGDDGALFRTTNGGLSWNPLNLFSINFISSCTPSSNSLFLGGDNGELVVTKDAGATWRVLTFAKYEGVTQIQFPTNQKGWLVLSSGSYGGAVYFTTDGGSTWSQTVRDSFSNPLVVQKIQFYDSLHGWYGEPAPVLLGKSPSLQPHLNSIGRFFRTTDGGTTWIESNTPGIINQFSFISQNEGWLSVTTFNDTLYKTTDGGIIWEPLSVIPNLHAADELTFVTENEGWLRIGGEVFHTQDGGTSFVKSVNGNIYGNYPRLYFASKDNGWFVGSYGMLMHYSKTSTIVIRRKLDITPSTFVLYQNYPNPFNPSTTIEFEVPTRALVRLSIYNILGQKVDELMNEVKDAGVYRIIWNAQNLASGTYFYRLQSNIAVATKKLLLLK